VSIYIELWQLCRSRRSVELYSSIAMMYIETLKARYCFIGNVMMFFQHKSLEIPSISLTLRSKKNVNVEIIQWFGFVFNIWSLMLSIKSLWMCLVILW